MKKLLLITAIFVGIIVVSGYISWAQSNYKLKTMTPVVEAALDQRQSRYDQLRVLKSQGKVGENNRGYVQALVEDLDVVAIVDAENSDRKVIYNTIIEQNNLKDAMEVIEKVFGRQQRDRAEVGDKIQEDDGKWTVKE